jgi:hypothetical protein
MNQRVEDAKKKGVRYRLDKQHQNTTSGSNDIIQ